MKEKYIFDVIELLDLIKINKSNDPVLKKEMWKISQTIRLLENYIDYWEDQVNHGK